MLSNDYRLFLIVYGRGWDLPPSCPPSVGDVVADLQRLLEHHPGVLGVKAPAAPPPVRPELDVHQVEASGDDLGRRPTIAVGIVDRGGHVGRSVVNA